MKLNDRADQILNAADYLGGGITLQIIYALYPDVQPDILRRLVSKLVKRRALAWTWAGELGRKVLLTTHGIEGHKSGVRKCLVDPDMARRALQTGCGGRAVKLPVKFIHNLIAGLVTLGLGACGAEFERELWSGPVGSHVADGVAWPERDRRILVEVERMIHQSPSRWTRKNGIVHRVAESLWIGPGRPNLQEQYLIVAPASVGAKYPDVEQELTDLILAKTKNLEATTRAMGWWFLPIEDLEADPRWHRVGKNSVSPRPLVGIRRRREAGEVAHKERARLDAERKEKKRQPRMASLPERPRRSTGTVIVCSDEQLRAMGCLPSLPAEDKPVGPPHGSDPTNFSNPSREAQTVQPRRSTRSVIVCSDEQLRAMGCLPSLPTEDKPTDPLPDLIDGVEK